MKLKYRILSVVYGKDRDNQHREREKKKSRIGYIDTYIYTRQRSKI